MYKNEYQGGPTVEILSAQGKDPLNKWKISGGNNAVKKSYEKEVKSFVFFLEGSTATSKLQLPKDGTRHSLCLTQRYLTMQVFIPAGKDFSIELSMTDTSNSKRRLVMSTSIREISKTPLHAKLNLSIVKRDLWLNLCFDLISLLSDIFRRQIFKSLDSITLAGNCKIRRIFTMRNQPPDTTDSEYVLNNFIGESDQSHLENIPPGLQFASTVTYTTQVINVQKIKNYLKPRDTSGYCSSSSDDLNNNSQSRQQHSSRLSARDQRPSHIAFGTRIRHDSSGSKTSRSSKKFDRRKRKESSSSQSSSISIQNGPTFKPAQSQKQNRNNNSNLRQPISNGASGDVGSAGASSQRFQNVEGMMKPAEHRGTSILSRGIYESLDNFPPALMNLVDEIEISGSDNESLYKEKPQNTGDNMFTFFSPPHLPQGNMDNIRSVKTAAERQNLFSNRLELEEDFNKSESSDSDVDVTKWIQGNTPSPRYRKANVNSPINLIQRSVPSKTVSQSWQQTETSVKSSPNHQYNRAKYTSKLPTHSQDFSYERSISKQQHSVAKSRMSLSTSLRGSDATLTASVDTIIHKSSKENGSDEEPDDSIEQSQASISGMTGTNPISSAFSPQQTTKEMTETERSEGNSSHRSVTVSKKTLREIPQNRMTEISPRFGNQIPESTSFQVGSWSESFEAHMLQNMKREQEEEMLQEDHALHKRDSGAGCRDATGRNFTYEDNLSDDESFDTSWSTWKQPPLMQSMAYKREMDGCVPMNKDLNTMAKSLGQSNPRDWANLFSPPIVLPSERVKQEKEGISDVESGGSSADVFGLSDGSAVSGHTSVHESDDEEMLDLMYDPCLNCYFDPRTGRYYELKG